MQLLQDTHTHRPNLAGQDVPERREGVVESLVINGLVEVLNEDVPDPTLPQRRVSLRPHDTNRTSLNHIKVHGVQSSLS